MQTLLSLLILDRIGRTATDTRCFCVAGRSRGIRGAFTGHSRGIPGALVGHSREMCVILMGSKDEFPRDNQSNGTGPIDAIPFGWQLDREKRVWVYVCVHIVLSSVRLVG